MVRKITVSFNSKDIITYQSVGKLLIALLKKEFTDLMGVPTEVAAPRPLAELVQIAVLKALSDDLLRPTTDYMFESEVKAAAKKVAAAVYADNPATPSEVVSEAQQLLLIDAYLKQIQEDKKATRDQKLKGKERTLSKEELAQYAPVQLSSKDAKAFAKEVDNKSRKKV